MSVCRTGGGASSSSPLSAEFFILKILEELAVLLLITKLHATWLGRFHFCEEAVIEISQLLSIVLSNPVERGVAQ